MYAKIDIVNAITITSHPSSPIQTLTVGSRLSLDQPPKVGHGLQALITCHRRSGITPCPEETYSIRP